MKRYRNPYYDPQRTHHRPWGFGNPPGSPRGNPFRIELAREGAHFLGQLWRAVGSPWPFPADHVLSEADALSGWHALRSSHKALWLGHAAFLLSMEGVHILTDPYLSDYASPVPMRTTRRLVPAAIREARLPQVDIIAISHNHYDHLDATALGRLADCHPDARVVVPLGLRQYLRRYFARVEELDWYEPASGLPIAVQAVPAIHMSRRGLGDTNRSLWCGFMFGDDARRCYFAGDTAYGPVFRELGERLPAPDLALVPIGAYQPRQLMKAVHCTPEEAVQIGLDLGAKRLIGMHWGTIRLTTEPLMEPRERFLAVPTEIPRQTLRIGETTAF